MDKEFHHRVERGSSKELEESYKVPVLFEKVMDYLRAQLPGMPQVAELVNIVRTLLHPGNIPVFRRVGVRMLLIWIREEKSCLPELITFFASCVQLRAFVETDADADAEAEAEIEPGPHQGPLDEKKKKRTRIELDQPDFPLAMANEPPLLAAHISVTAKEQATIMVTEILNFMTFDGKADRRSTEHLLGLFREHYLRLIYPHVCATHDLVKKPIPEGVGLVDGCPGALQSVMMRYFAMWTMQQTEMLASHAPSYLPSSGSLPVAAFLLPELLMNNRDDLALLHEVLRQSLLLPYGYKPVIKVALSMLRSWVFTTRERRPIFLQVAPTHRPTMQLIEEKGIPAEAVLDHYLMGYMTLIELLFDADRVSATYKDEQLELYKEGLFFLRGLLMKAFFTLGSAAKEKLMYTLLSLYKKVLGSPGAHQSPLIPDADVADAFVHLLSETVFGAWIRSETEAPEHWGALGSVLGAATAWTAIMDEWLKTIMVLTNMMCEKYFVDPAAVSEDASTASRKRHICSGTFESENLVSLASSQSLIGRAVSVQLSPASGPAPSPSLTSGHKLGNLPSDGFLAWKELPWCQEHIVFLWRNVLQIFGDIHAINRPDIHEVALRAHVQVFERLLEVRESQPYVWRPLPPIYESANIFFEACELPARAFERSRCLAYSALCRMFIRNKDMEIPDEDQVLIRLYLAILAGLGDKDDPVATVILLSASRILSRPLPGMTMLIPAFLKCIAGFLNNHIPLEKSPTLVPIMRIIQNIAAMSRILPSMMLPRLEAPLAIMSSMPITCAGEIEFSSLRMQAKDFLLMVDMQEYARTDAPTHAVYLSVVNVLLLNELIVPAGRGDSYNESLMDGYLNVLLDHLISNHSPVLPSIIDQFSALAQLYPLFGERLSKQREYLIIQRLLTAIRSASSAADMTAKQQDELTSRMINVLLEWVLAMPHDWFGGQHSLKEQMFSVLEEALRKEDPVAPLPSTRQGPTKRVVVGVKEPVEGNDEDPPTDSSSLCREAAEYALVNLMHHLNHYPPAFGATMLGTVVNEPSLGASTFADDRTLYFALGDSALVAVQQMSGPSLDKDSPHIRVIVRNAAGKFCWDSRAFYETFMHRDCVLFPSDSPAEWIKVGLRDRPSLAPTYSLTTQLPLTIHPHGKDGGEEREKRLHKLPTFQEGVTDLGHEDMLRNLISYLDTEHGEAVSDIIDECVTGRLTSPRKIRADYRDFVVEIERTCQEHMKMETSLCKKYHTAVSHETMTGDCDHVKAKPKVHSQAMRATPYEHCRHFLVNLGFLSPTVGTVTNANPRSSSENLDAQVHIAMPLKVLGKTSGMLRDMKGLDKKPARELVRVAVLYVGPGQEDELTVLRNGPEDISEAYGAFLETLGWRVDLRTHPGYAGGLEVDNVLDHQALYYCTATLECVFHEAASLVMGSEEDDPQIVAKKRHLSNDHVQIIWNEHNRDYRPHPRGDYGNVVIVVTPLPHIRLFSISIFRDAQVSSFGPLFDGALLPAAILGPLLRTTAINAHRAALAALGRRNRNALAQRAQDIQMIVKRHAHNGWTLDQFLRHVMFGGDMVAAVGSTEMVTESSENLAKLQLNE